MPYLAVSVLFLLSRAAASWAGLPFVFSLDWMWLSDPADLRDRLAQTLWLFHAFPPGMDLLTGVLLKAGGQQVAALASAVFWVLGLILANALVALGLALGLGPRAAVGVATMFLVSPPALYFGHLYLYEWPIVTLLAVSAVCLHRAIASEAPRWWLAFFTVCAVIAVTRSTFHLVWILLLVGAGLVVSSRARRLVVVAAALPGLLLVLLVYGKNAILFGEFAASTFGPASLHLVTVARLPRSERDRWITDGRLSPFAAISPYAPPREYAPYFGSASRPDWPPQLTRLERESVAAPNFNHWFLLEAHRARQRDVETYLLAHPIGYLRNVWAGLQVLLGPSTDWHPRFGTPAEPHAVHRRVLGRYVVAYNSLLHGAPFKPVGLYVMLPVLLWWATREAWTTLRTGTPHERARAALLAYCLFQIVFVVAISSMATFLESSRYRFQVEPFIWMLAALAGTRLIAHGRLPDRRHV